MEHLVGGLRANQVFESGGAVALANAACRGDGSGVERVIRAGADVNSTGRDGISLLHWVLTCESYDGLSALLRNGTDPNRLDNYGRGAVYYAATYRNGEYLKLLLRSGGNPNQFDIYGYSPMEAAIRFFRETGSRSNIDHLLSAGADISLTGPTGKTVVEIAAMRRQYGVVEIFLNAGYSGDRERLLDYVSMGLSDRSTQEGRARERIIRRLNDELGLR